MNATKFLRDYFGNHRLIVHSRNADGTFPPAPKGAKETFACFILPFGKVEKSSSAPGGLAEYIVYLPE